MPAKLRADQIATPAGAFFNSPAAAPFGAALRQPNRFFLGVGHAHGGQTDGNVTGGSWLQSFASPNAQADFTKVVGWDYFEDLARLASVSDFGIAISGVSRTNGADAIGVNGAVVASSIGGNAWGGYYDGARVVAGAGSVTGIEINSAQVAEPSPGNAGWTEFFHMGKTPMKAPVVGQCVALGLGGGSDALVFGRSYASDTAIGIGNNGGAFWTGINFRFNAIMREGMTDDRSAPGLQGYARAIGLAHEQGLSWYSSIAQIFTAGAFATGRTYIIQTVGTTDFTLIGAAANTIGVGFTATGAGSGDGTASLVGSQAEVLRIYSAITSASVRQSLEFNDSVISFNERSGPGAALFQIDYRTDAAANVYVGAAASGSSPKVGVRGTLANIALTLAPKGTGWVTFGNIGNVPEYANDEAADSGGLNIGGIYRTGSELKVRVA